MDDTLAAAVADTVIEQARQQTTAQLRARLRRLLIAADPDLASKKARRAIRDRRVASYTDEDTQLASLAGYELSPGRVAAVMERLDAIARASKAAGDQRSMDQLRADAFLDLLSGQGVALGGEISLGDLGLSPEGAEPAAEDPPADTGEVPWPDQPLPPGAAGLDPADPRLAGLDGGPPDGAVTEDAVPGDAVPEGAAAADGTAEGAMPERAATADGTAGETPGEPAGEPAGPAGEPAGPAGKPAGRVDPWAFGVGGPPPGPDVCDHHDDVDDFERRRWLADFDRLPPVRPASRCVLCGQLDGPPPAPGPLPGPRAGVVEITASLETLLGLAELPAELTGYGPVAADIARQVIAGMHEATWRYAVHDPLCRLAHHGTTTTARPDPTSSPPGSSPPGGSTEQGEHRTSRRPGAALTAYIKARDRGCVAPGCRRPARRCDVDHTWDWVKGGETVHCNLAVLCRQHHLFKHATGCELVQFTPGGFGWSTPAGLQYLTRSGPPPLIQANELAGLPVPGKPANPDVALLHAAQRETVPVLASPADLSDPDEVIHETPDPGG